MHNKIKRDEAKQLKKDMKKKKLLLDRIPTIEISPESLANNETEIKKVSKKKKVKKIKNRKKIKKEVVEDEMDKRQLISIALPGSILGNAQTLELKTFLAGQIARAAAIFRIHEIVVFHEHVSYDKFDFTAENGSDEIKLDDFLYLLDDFNNPGYHTVLLGYLLQFMECPQYLRKMLFPKHECLSKTGSLPPLATDSHVADSDNAIYREGCVLKGPCFDGQTREDGFCNLVNAGVHDSVHIDQTLEPYTRVTVRMTPAVKEPVTEGDKPGSVEAPKSTSAVVVSRDEPFLKAGLNWGYRIRLANSLTGALKGSARPYDLIIGTSDKGSSVDRFQAPPTWRNALIVLGGVQGLEHSIIHDPKCDLVTIEELFPHYINTCPRQGSRTIRTEEALLITLAGLRPKLMQWSNIS